MNHSWGTDKYSQSLEEVIEAADANGILSIGSSGNSDWLVLYPAKFDEVIAVGATDANDIRWNYSNFGSALDVVAPSGQYSGYDTVFWSTDISGSAGWNPGDISEGDAAGNYTKWMSGTSAAAPQVAGLAALILSIDPNFTPAEVSSIITSTADDKGDVGWDPYYGWGRINIYKALVEAAKQANKQAVKISKVDDIEDSVLPGDEITYTISFENTVSGPAGSGFPFGQLTNVKIVDYLADEVDYTDTSDANYSPLNHTYTWNIGALEEDEADSVQLAVLVNNLAEPNGTITNYCVIEADQISPTTAIKVTDVNCWSPDIIYVDVNAMVWHNVGISWQHAYTDLQDALETARDCGCNEIWVAEGTYYTHTESGDAYWSAAFELVNGVGLFGGFEGNETDRNQRNWLENKTILEGNLLGGDSLSDTDHIIIATDVNEATVLDGFTVQNSFYAGIKIDNASPVIKNTIIKDTKGYNGDGEHPYAGSGISCANNSSPKIENSELISNNYYGIYTRSNSSLNIENCELLSNNDHGIYSENSTLTIEDCNIIENGKAGINGGGIYCSSSSLNLTNCLISDNLAYQGAGLYNCDSSIVNIADSIVSGNYADMYGGGIYNNQSHSSSKIKNCLFISNESYYTGAGIENEESSPQIIGCTFNGNTVENTSYGDGGAIDNYSNSEPTVTNCILWGDSPSEIHNDSSSPTVKYCDIQGNPVYPGEGNINSDPDFYAPDVNNFHLTPNDSPCIDAGNPDFRPEPNETDIDGEERIFDGDENGTAVVDMGADEYYWSPADFDANEIVNFVDFALFASAWGTTPADANYNDTYDLADNDIIDNNDLDLFCQDWLWQSAWGTQPTVGRCSAMGGSLSSMEVSSMEVLEIQKTEPIQPKPVEINPEQLYNFLKDVEGFWSTEPELRDKLNEDDWLKFIDSLWDLYQDITQESAD